MNDLTEIQPPSQSNATSALMLELAKCLKLVAPASMTSDAQLVWLQAAVDALEGIRANEVAAISLELRRTVTRPAQIVAEIARLVGQHRARSKDVPSPERRTLVQRRVEEGNRYLAKIGRRDCHWIERNGECVIESI